MFAYSHFLSINVHDIIEKTLSSLAAAFSPLLKCTKIKRKILKKCTDKVTKGGKVSSHSDEALASITWNWENRAFFNQIICLTWRLITATTNTTTTTNTQSQPPPDISRIILVWETQPKRSHQVSSSSSSSTLVKQLLPVLKTTLLNSNPKVKQQQAGKCSKCFFILFNFAAVSQTLSITLPVSWSYGVSVASNWGAYFCKCGGCIDDAGADAGGARKHRSITSAGSHTWTHQQGTHAHAHTHTKCSHSHRWSATSEGILDGNENRGSEDRWVVGLHKHSQEEGKSKILSKTA